MQNLRLVWEVLKYKIRQDTIPDSKGKAKERRAKMSELEGKLKQCQLLCDQDPSTENINRLKILKTDLWYEHMAKGAIVRSTAN